MIGTRLSEEREKNGMTQPQLGKLVGGIAPRTIIDWEKNRTAPTAYHLSILAEHGFDTHYIVTGQRSGPIVPCDPAEGAILDIYRRASQASKAAIVGAVAGIGGVALTGLTHATSSHSPEARIEADKFDEYEKVRRDAAVASANRAVAPKKPKADKPDAD